MSLAGSVVVGGTATTSTNGLMSSEDKAKLDQQDTANDKTGATYEIQLTDHGKTLFFTYAGEVTVTLPEGLSETVHVTCIVVDAAGSIVFVNADTGTLDSKGALYSVTDQFGAATVVHRGSDKWYLFGDLA
jgi:hypothetical protein